jgi:hypothetical protein
MKLPQFEAGQIVSAKQWNAIAWEVNRIWATETGPGLRLTKSKKWRLTQTTRLNPPTPECDAGGLNGPAYRVFVWRGDKWDYGSANPPLAFFVGGNFTQWGAQSAVRIAKFVPTTDCELNSTGVDPEWQALNQFGGPVYFLSTTKDTTPYLLVGTQSGAQRNATGGYDVAWLIDWDSGELKSGFTPIAGSSIGPGFYGQVNSLVAIESYIIACRFTAIYQRHIPSNGGSGLIGAPVNIHNLAGASDKFFLSSRKVLGDPPDPLTPNIYDVEPRSLAYLEPNYSVETIFDTFAGVGGATDCFTMALAPKEPWNNEFDEDKICWSVHSKEFTGTAYSWAGTVYNSSVPAPTSMIVPITKAGMLHPMTGSGGGLVATFGGRAQVFCYYDGAVWFGGSMTSVSSSTVGPISCTANNSLCRFEINSGNIDVFDFNGPVYDCQHFHDGQMIVVGNFTEYLITGTPVSYMAFISQSGSLFENLEWPA